MSVHSHSSFSGGSTASSTRRSEEGGGEGDEWDEDPSFSSAHFHTSTPLKSARAVRLQRSPNAEQEETEPEEGGDEEEGMLRASDTESVGDGVKDSKSNTRLRLTRRSLSLSSYQPTPLSSNSVAQQTFTSSRPFSPSTSSSAITPRQGGSTNLQPSYPAHLAPGYTPSVSTGSSTLVDRDDPPIPSSTRTIKGKGREDVTIRPSPGAPFSTVDEEDSSAPLDDNGSSSSPRPLRSKPRRGVELSTYINSHTSTPPPTSRSSYPLRSSNPSTPLAPGAYPPTARKPFPRRSLPSSSILHDTPPPPAGSRQVHDAFQRYITGPSGALIHSAERRAAAAAAAMVVPPSAARRKDYSEQREPPTPHPAGYYAFEASTSLPIERDRRRKEAIPSSEERRRREVTWREDVAGGEEDDGEEKEEEAAARAGDSPSHRPSSRAGAPSKLEKTLRHMNQLQRETEGRRRISEAPPPPPPPNLDDYFAPMAEYEEEVEQEKQARARDYDGDYSSEDKVSDEEAPRLAGRSAIDFAMARSFAVSSGDQSIEEEEVAQEEERSAPPPPAAPSPPRSSRRSPFRPPSPPSPSLPELPPLPSPQSSPTKPRAPLGRSSAAHDPPRHRPPPQPQPSPPRAPPQPSPPRAPINATSPPRTTRQRRPSFDTIPTSSTPPRRFVDPPAPAGTPLAAPTRLKSLSSSLQAPRADPTPAPRRRATSLSPSRSPRPSSGLSMLPAEHEHEHDDLLPAIVADLVVAVRALSSTSGAELRRDGLPAARRGSLAGVLARRKKESEGRTRGLEEELRVLESRVGGGAATREAVLSRLEQAQEVEKELSAKIDDSMRSAEQMGQAVGTQVANGVQDTLQDEARQRTSWFAIAFFLQLLAFFIFTRITASRNSDFYQTIYYDPFSPSLFHLSSAAYSDSASVLPQTLELFGPHLGGGGAAGVVKSWFGGRLGEVAAWGVEQSAEGRGWVPS